VYDNKIDMEVRLLNLVDSKTARNITHTPAKIRALWGSKSEGRHKENRPDPGGGAPSCWPIIDSRNLQTLGIPSQLCSWLSGGSKTPVGSRRHRRPIRHGGISGIIRGGWGVGSLGPSWFSRFSPLTTQPPDITVVLQLGGVSESETWATAPRISGRGGLPGATFEANENQICQVLRAAPRSRTFFDQHRENRSWFAHHTGSSSNLSPDNLSTPVPHLSFCTVSGCQGESVFSGICSEVEPVIVSRPRRRFDRRDGSICRSGQVRQGKCS